MCDIRPPDRQPLWVKSRHDALKWRCPLYPQKRTLFSAVSMSALCQKQTSAASFDHLVGYGEYAGWNCKAKRPRSIEIDNELELGRLLHRQIGRFGTF